VSFCHPQGFESSTALSLGEISETMALAAPVRCGGLTTPSPGHGQQVPGPESGSHARSHLAVLAVSGLVGALHSRRSEGRLPRRYRRVARRAEAKEPLLQKLLHRMDSSATPAQAAKSSAEAASTSSTKAAAASSTTKAAAASSAKTAAASSAKAVAASSAKAAAVIAPVAATMPAASVPSASADPIAFDWTAAVNQLTTQLEEFSKLLLAEVPKELQEVPKELREPAELFLKSVSAGMPLELKTEVAKVLASLSLPSIAEISAILSSPQVSAATAPAGAGLVVVLLLALRRGRQPWLEELPLRYDGPWIAEYWKRRPVQLVQRFVDVSLRCGVLSLGLELDKLLGNEKEMEAQRARESKELITDLGPAFVKIVQVWASRPDILPEAYQKEFEQLLERVRPFGKDEALETLCRNIGGEEKVRSMFDSMSAFDEPVAAASIGQVYKASMKGRPVAVKVQRPDVREQVTLDLFVIRQLSIWGSYLPIERFSRQFKSLFELVDRAAPPFIEELDYEAEAANQKKFAELISNCDLVKDTVTVPEVLFSCREALVQEWLEGTKLTEEGAAKEQSQQVVKVLLNAYMVQLLETGFLHGDPHPGNFVLTPEGKLGILDFGLVTTVSEEKRVALIEYIMHVQANMYDECLTDLVNLEFLPAGIADDKEAREVIVPGLANTLNILFEQSDLRVQREKFIKQRKDLEESGKLEVLQKELQAIAQKYGSFRLPGYATLIIRALATLEGVGLKSSDGGSFSLAAETFPYIARRLLTDDSLRIREALRAYLYKGRSRISAKRVEDLATGFSSFTNLMKGSREEAAANGAPTPKVEGARMPSAEDRATVDFATKDIAAVIFSPDGNFLQELLIEEGVASVDALSRASVLQLARNLGPLAAPLTAPLSLLLGGDMESKLLSREDKEALLLLRKIVQLIQGDSNGENVEAAAMTTDDVVRTLQDLQRLQPLAAGLLPSITPGAASFARRFSSQLASRALMRLATDIERGAGLQGTPVAA